MPTYKKSFIHPDVFLWVLVIGIPMVCVILPMACAIRLFVLKISTFENILILIALSAMAAWEDMRQLEHTDRNVPDTWTIAVTPVYLWQRINRNNQSIVFLFAWIFASITAVFISANQDVITAFLVAVFS